MGNQYVPVWNHEIIDPAVLTDDDGRVYLYYGSAPACEKEMLLLEFSEEELKAMPLSKRKEYEGLRDIVWGEDSIVVELEPDMLTTKEFFFICQKSDIKRIEMTK